MPRSPAAAAAPAARRISKRRNPEEKEDDFVPPLELGAEDPTDDDPPPPPAVKAATTQNVLLHSALPTITDRELPKSKPAFEALASVERSNPGVLNLNNMFSAAVLDHVPAVLSTLKKCKSDKISDEDSYKNFRKWPIAKFLENWGQAIHIKANASQAMLSVHAAVGSLRLLDFTEEDIDELAGELYSMVTTHGTELEAMTLESSKTFFLNIITKTIANFENAKTVRDTVTINFREYCAERDATDRITVTDFHVFLTAELQKKEKAASTLLGYVKPHPDDRARGSSSSLNAMSASNSERAEKVNHGTVRCYGCHRPGHSGDSCYKKGEPGFNTNKDIPWSESPNGKILMSMGFKVLGGNRPSNRDASGKAPFWKKARKQLCECIYI